MFSHKMVFFPDCFTEIQHASKLVVGAPSLVVGTPRQVVGTPRLIVIALRLVVSAHTSVADASGLVTSGSRFAASASRLVAATPRCSQVQWKFSPALRGVSNLITITLMILQCQFSEIPVTAKASRNAFWDSDTLLKFTHLSLHSSSSPTLLEASSD
jgi:hypothetical protein